MNSVKEGTSSTHRQKIIRERIGIESSTQELKSPCKGLVLTLDGYLALD